MIASWHSQVNVYVTCFYRIRAFPRKRIKNRTSGAGAAIKSPKYCLFIDMAYFPVLPGMNGVISAHKARWSAFQLPEMLPACHFKIVTRRFIHRTDHPPVFISEAAPVFFCPIFVWLPGFSLHPDLLNTKPGVDMIHAIHTNSA